MFSTVFTWVIMVLLALVIITAVVRGAQSVLFSFIDYQDHNRPWTREEKVIVVLYVGPGLCVIAGGMLWNAVLKPLLV